MEVPRLGVKSELQLLVYATAIKTQDPSHVCDLHHSSWQCQILSPLSKAWDQTCNLMVPSQICFLLRHDGNSIFLNVLLYGFTTICFSSTYSWIFGLFSSFCLLKIKQLSTVFTAVLFTIAKTWKQPKCSLTEEWIKMWYIYTMEYYSAIKRVK